ncbi:uncharacterized protein FIBRA_00765 [Fibroporia radiculosa]|uniref:Uncharacterized protein n=1 Tax=Fibroporia radiculosa TaxID=599839 RepID=J4GIJ2_9APHY|nr:uncharacterized protein FIBRA_00765 [Fibroporia radiculosa]CCL98760.1 predicted protein [Fibroporia radiculosa]
MSLMPRGEVRYVHIDIYPLFYPAARSVKVVDSYKEPPNFDLVSSKAFLCGADELIRLVQAHVRDEYAAKLAACGQEYEQLQQQTTAALAAANTRADLAEAQGRISVLEAEAESAAAAAEVRKLQEVLMAREREVQEWKDRCDALEAQIRMKTESERDMLNWKERCAALEGEHDRVVSVARAENQLLRERISSLEADLSSLRPTSAFVHDDYNDKDDCLMFDANDQGLFDSSGSYVRKQLLLSPDSFSDDASLEVQHEKAGPECVMTQALFHEFIDNETFLEPANDATHEPLCRASPRAADCAAPDSFYPLSGTTAVSTPPPHPAAASSPPAKSISPEIKNRRSSVAQHHPSTSARQLVFRSPLQAYKFRRPSNKLRASPMDEHESENGFYVRG